MSLVGMSLSRVLEGYCEHCYNLCPWQHSGGIEESSSSQPSQLPSARDFEAVPAETIEGAIRPN